VTVERNNGPPSGSNSGAPLSPLDIKPEDCTLTLLALAIKDPDNADDYMRRVENRISAKDGKPALGCIACNALLTLDGGYENEPSGTGICRAPFGGESRKLVAPKTDARGENIVNRALRASK
jgi:hypothetical protein